MIKLRTRVWTSCVLALLLAAGAPVRAQTGDAPPAPASEAAPAQAAEPAANPDGPFAPGELILALELSSGGTVRILMRPDKAPGHVARIQTLTRAGFYNGLKFHRVVPGFMAQGGDPQGTGEGGSTRPDIKAEFNDLMHLRGAAAMARSQSPDSANSQFYIMLQPNFDLDNNYTVWGRVISGMEAVDGIAQGEPPENPTVIARAWLEATPQATAAAPAATQSN